MDFKCDQEFVLMSCECADRLFPFLANMAAIIAICRFFRGETKNRLASVKIFLEMFWCVECIQNNSQSMYKSIYGHFFLLPFFISRGPYFPVKLKGWNQPLIKVP